MERIQINPNGRKEKRILINLLSVLELEKPISPQELEERIRLWGGIKNPHPQMFKDYKAIYELLFGIAISRGLVRLGYFCNNGCEYSLSCQSISGDPCYMLTEEGTEYLQEKSRSRLK